MEPCVSLGVHHKQLLTRFYPPSAISLLTLHSDARAGVGSCRERSHHPSQVMTER